MKLTQEENMTLDMMTDSINDQLKDALVADDRESDAEVLQAQYGLLRKLRQIAAAPVAAQGEFQPLIDAVIAAYRLPGNRPSAIEARSQAKHELMTAIICAAIIE